MTTRAPTVIIFAGPNGAGKSSASGPLLPSVFPTDRMVNPDVIARALDPNDPTRAAMRAGRAALDAICRFRDERLDFAFETTLSGRWTERAVNGLLASGYDITLHFLWLPSPEMAIARVHARASRGEHDVPVEDVKRRYYRGLVNFAEVGLPLSTRWSVRDARIVGTDALVAQGAGVDVQVHNAQTWQTVQTSIAGARMRLAGAKHNDSQRGR